MRYNWLGPVLATPVQSLEMPSRFAPRRLARRAMPVVAGVTAIVLVVVLAPGLGDVRNQLSDATLGWAFVALGFELASTGSYVLLFRPVFCGRMQWRVSTEIGLSEVGMGSLVPASGAGGLALGAWVLNRRGMSADRIARRSVAFFLIKSSVNFVAVAVLGGLLAVGLIGPDLSLALTALPAVMATALIAAVLLLPRLGPGPDPPPGAGRFRRGTSAARRSLIKGTAEAVMLVRSRDPVLLVGAIGYWAFDNAALWAAYHAVGDTPPLSIVLLGYLIGQLGGLLPLPGGLGGIDGGLIGTLIVYGADPASTAAAVVLYRLLLFWVPLITGVPAFVALTQRLKREGRAAVSA